MLTIARPHNLPLSFDNWENEGGSLRGKSPRKIAGSARLLAGIFVIGRHRFTTLAKAAAQAKREAALLPGQKET